MQQVVDRGTSGWAAPYKNTSDFRRVYYMGPQHINAAENIFYIVFANNFRRLYNLMDKLMDNSRCIGLNKPTNAYPWYEMLY